MPVLAVQGKATRGRTSRAMRSGAKTRSQMMITTISTEMQEKRVPKVAPTPKPIKISPALASEMKVLRVASSIEHMEAMPLVKRK